jgi:phage baseplate assembly protein W
MPWGMDVASFIEPKDDVDILKSSIQFIILTNPGERVMLPEFGAGVRGALFEQNDDELRGMLQESIRAALARWDDRIELRDLQVEQTEHRLDIHISFQNVKDPMEDSVQVLDVSLPATI